MRFWIVALVGALVLAPTTAAVLPAEEEVALALQQSIATSYEVTDEGVEVDLFAKCAQRTKKITAEAFGTIDLWWIRQRVAWCWGPQSNEPTPGPVVQVIKSGPWWTPKCRGRSYGITAAGFHWEWVGWVDCKASGGVGNTYVKRWTKGHFKLCNPAAGCIQNGFPYAWVRGNTGGSSSAGGGGVG